GLHDGSRQFRCARESLGRVRRGSGLEEIERGAWIRKHRVQHLHLVPLPYALFADLVRRFRSVQIAKEPCMLRGIAREAVAEFLGTFTLLVFGIAVVAQVVLSRQSAGQYLSINIGWGLAVTMGAYVAGGVSGAHLNPAVTLALAFHRGFPWEKGVPYALAQLAGAVVAALVVYVTYRGAVRNLHHGIPRGTGPGVT